MPLLGVPDLHLRVQGLEQAELGRGLDQADLVGDLEPVPFGLQPEGLHELGLRRRDREALCADPHEFRRGRVQLVDEPFPVAFGFALDAEPAGLHQLLQQRHELGMIRRTLEGAGRFLDADVHHHGIVLAEVPLGLGAAQLGRAAGHEEDKGGGNEQASHREILPRRERKQVTKAQEAALRADTKGSRTTTISSLVYFFVCLRG